MDRIFNSLSRLGVDFASVRHETTRGLTISMLDGILKVDVNDSMDGYMLKVLREEATATGASSRSPRSKTSGSPRRSDPETARTRRPKSSRSKTRRASGWGAA